MTTKQTNAARVLLTITILASGALPVKAQTTPDDRTSVSEDSLLQSDLAEADSAFFHALFVTCDADRANAMLTEDVEFYDDRTGLSSGDDLRADFRRLAANCPAHNGVRRIPLAGTIDVYPIAGYGAVRMGTHHFVEQGASTSTTARFVIVWRRVGSEWRIARVLSVDHRIVDSAEAAELRDPY